MTPLPFSDFLEALRSKGFGVGLHEHLALGKLLDRWSSTDRDELRNSLAALLARHEEDVAQIKNLFDESYPGVTETPPRPRGAGRTEVDDGTNRFRLIRLVRNARAWVMLVLTAALLSSALLAVRTYTRMPTLPIPVSPLAGAIAVPPPRAPGTPALPSFVTETASPPASPLPTPTPQIDWRGIGWLGSGALAVSLLSFWGVGLRVRARQWTIEAWQSSLSALPGPFHGALVLKDLVTRLPRADVEEAATILGRSFSPDRLGRELDVKASLKRTLASGMQPHLVFRPRRVQQTILVLQDVSQSMAPHARRVDGFYGDLLRQGIALERWFFDGDVSMPTRRPFGQPTPLDALLRAREDGPLMVLSAGFGAPAVLKKPDAEWAKALRTREARVWINPVTDPNLWPAAMARLPLLVVPMSRAGLLQAARVLAHGEQAAGTKVGRTVTAPETVTPAHLHRLKQLASLVPYPTPDLLELLRQRFAPDIPESAVFYTVSRRNAHTDLPFRMKDEEIREKLREIRAESPTLESSVRQYLLKVLGDSEPPPGSAAHLRWEASMALHRVQVAELAHEDGTAAVAEIERLHQSPLWEEIRDMVARQPSTGPITNDLRRSIAHAGGADPPSYAAPFTDKSRVPPFRWRPPVFREIALAAGVALLVTAGGGLTPAFHVQASHLPDAYALDYIAGSDVAGDRGQLRVRRTGSADLAPVQISVYRNSDIVAAVPVDAPLPYNVPIGAGTGAGIYQVRAQLSTGGLALSNTVWAPSVLVSIDAQPWANVTIASPDNSVPAVTQTTPVAIRLPEGRYNVSLDNGGVTAPRADSITVTTGGQRDFRFVMPGFAPSDVVRQLAPPPPTASKK